MYFVVLFLFALLIILTLETLAFNRFKGTAIVYGVASFVFLALIPFAGLCDLVDFHLTLLKLFGNASTVNFVSTASLISIALFMLLSAVIVIAFSSKIATYILEVKIFSIKFETPKVLVSDTYSPLVLSLNTQKLLCRYNC